MSFKFLILGAELLLQYALNTYLETMISKIIFIVTTVVSGACSMIYVFISYQGDVIGLFTSGFAVVIISCIFGIIMSAFYCIGRAIIDYTPWG